MAEEQRGSDWAGRSVPIWIVALVIALPLFGDVMLNSNKSDVDAPGRVARADVRERRKPRVRRPVRAVPVARGKTDLSAYRGLGSWIDIYNNWPWDHPAAAVNVLKRKGVKTIFLQTSNWGADDPIYRPGATAKLLHAAHRKNMKVVAWYVPSFAHEKYDRRRSLAPIRFKTSKGHRFDSFGMDIESTVVDRIKLRNKRFLNLSKWLRSKIGDEYPLGAITPDPVTGLYWPDFPYKATRRLYDVFVPMGYFSFRVSGYRDVKKYTAAGIRTIRRETEDPKVPVHWIGGIAGETEHYEVKGFVRALKGHNALGGSYYDFIITTPEEWSELGVLAGREPPARKGPKKDEPERKPKKSDKKKPKKAKKNDKKKRAGKKDNGKSRKGDRSKKSGRKDRKKKDAKAVPTDEAVESVEEGPNARRLL
jgi:hypothetical protein